MTRTLVAVAVLWFVHNSAIAADDEVKDRLYAAKKAYDAEMNGYRKQAAEWFDKREADARKDGDKKLVDQIKTERSKFDAVGALPATAPSAIRQRLALAKKSLEAAYAQAVKDYLKLKKDSEAAAIESQWKEFVRANGVDLLALIDAKTHRVQGEWKKSTEGLYGASIDKPARLQLPYEPGEEYDVEITCKWIVGKDAFCVGLAAGGRQVVAVIDGNPMKGYHSGIDVVDGKFWDENITTTKGQSLKEDADNEIVCSVRRDRIEVQVNAKRATTFKGNSARLSFRDSAFAVPNKKALFLHIGPGTVFRITRIVVRPADGEGKTLK